MRKEGRGVGKVGQIYLIETEARVSVEADLMLVSVQVGCAVAPVELVWDCINEAVRGRSLETRPGSPTRAFRCRVEPRSMRKPRKEGKIMQTGMAERAVSLFPVRKTNQVGWRRWGGQRFHGR